MRNALTRFPDVDAWLDSWTDQFSSAETSTFPHYDIVKVSENEYRIDLAVAGFSRDNLDVSAEANVLTIKGTKSTEPTDETFVHRGIAKRQFTKQFSLGEQLRVEGASMEDGILRIGLFREIPEHLKPSIIHIM
jgi:molecular chaperone IbpA